MYLNRTHAQNSNKKAVQADPAMPLHIPIRLHIEFYNKSIMEHLCMLNTATLSMRTHLAPKPAQNTSNHVWRSFKVTHFGITEKPTRNCVLLWALESEISNERSERLRFENPTVIRCPLSREPLWIFAEVLYFWNYNHWRTLCRIGYSMRMSSFKFSGGRCKTIKRFFAKVRFGRSRSSKVIDAYHLKACMRLPISSS